MPLRMRTRDFSSLFPLQRLFRLFHFPEMEHRPTDLGPLEAGQPRYAMTLAGCWLVGPIGEENFRPVLGRENFPSENSLLRQ